MRPIRETITAVANIVVPVDYQQPDFKIGLQMEFTGVATASAEATMDDVQDSDITPVWFGITDMTAISANVQGNVIIPIRAVRFNVTAYTNGDVNFTLLQPDSNN